MLQFLGWLWQLIKDGFNWVTDRGEEGLEWLANSVLLPMWEQCKVVLKLLWEWLRDWIIESFRSLCEWLQSMGYDIDPDKIIEAVQGVWSFIVELNYLIPLGKMISIWFVAFIAVMIIRLYRTIKAHIPTMGD